MGVVPDFGTQVDGGEDGGGIDPNIVEYIGTEQGDEGQGMGVEVRDTGDVPEEVAFDEFLLWNPKLLTTVVNNGVLVRVAVSDESASRGGEEVGEDIG